METSNASPARAAAQDLAPAQLRRLEAFTASACVDVHCHCLPCVDDGPASLIESIAMCRSLVDDGITTVVATPHQLGRYHGRNEGPEVRKAVEALRRSLMVEGVPLRVLPGGDVRLDERIVRLLAEGRVLTLAGGTYLLLELPSDTFIDGLPLLSRLAEDGVRPIISHPERNRFLTARPELVDRWLAAGAVLQITAGSLLGEFGAMAQRAAWFWMDNGQASLVASDAHGSSGRPPRMTRAIELITRRLGHEVARRVCVENPRRVLESCALEQVLEPSDPLGDLSL